MAPAGGHRVLGVWIGPALGPFAWATLAFGAATGVVGIVLIAIGRTAPRGPFVLPGYDY